MEDSGRGSPQVPFTEICRHHPRCTGGCRRSEPKLETPSRNQGTINHGQDCLCSQERYQPREFLGVSVNHPTAVGGERWSGIISKKYYIVDPENYMLIGKYFPKGMYKGIVGIYQKAFREFKWLFIATVRMRISR